MKRIVCLPALFLLLTLSVGAQTATVRSNVNLRPDPSTENNPITSVKPPAQLDLVEPDATDGYFHVTTSDGQEGWVWGRNIKLNTATVSTAASAGHVGPAQLYPDPTKTPGLAATLKASDLTKRYTEGCPSGKSSCTYSQKMRNVPAAVHTHVFDEYNVAAADRNIKYGEVDHFYPLCAGGSNDIQNLWDQPADNQWNGENYGYHEKDKLETYVCEQIKAGKMDPKDAYNRIKSDWVKFYLDVGLNSVN
jgi:hypothetical protein